jgi:multidrug transporter EmrE-like cation transporter
VVAIVLSVLIYRERLTPVRVVGISLTVVSLILLRA